MHDTPRSLLSVGLGVGWIDQLVPSQRSTSAFAPELFNPTAVQELTDVHDTPLSELSLELAGLGECWIDQLVPSQRSTSGFWPELAREYPTAVQELTDVHDIP